MRFHVLLAVLCLFLMQVQSRGWFGGDDESVKEKGMSDGDEDDAMDRDATASSQRARSSAAGVKKAPKGSEARKAREIVPDAPARHAPATHPEDVKAKAAVLKLEAAVSRFFSAFKTGSGASSAWSSGVESVVDSSAKKFIGKDAYRVLAKKCSAVERQGWAPVIKPLWTCAVDRVFDTVMSAVDPAAVTVN